METVLPFMGATILNPTQAGEFLQIHEKTAIRMARDGQLPGFRIGKHWRFRAEDLTAWVAEQVESNRQPVE